MKDIIKANHTNEIVNTKILILNRTQVASLLSLPDYIEAMEIAFKKYSNGEVIDPDLMHVDVENGEFHIKGGGIILDRPYYALKANGGFFGNSVNYNLPNINGLILVFDGIKGIPIAVMDSIDITVKRTGATSAVAAKYLAKSDSSVVTICGCGYQGRIQLESLMQVFPNIKKVYAWDMNSKNSSQFALEMSEKLDVDVKSVEALEFATLKSDIVITCTPSSKYFLKYEYIQPGTFVSAVGADSPTKQEIDPNLLANSKVIVDVLDQCSNVGELHHALDAEIMSIDDVHGSLGDVLTKKISGRTNSDEIIIFDTTGSAIQDATVAVMVYKKAIFDKVGLSFEIYD